MPYFVPAYTDTPDNKNMERRKNIYDKEIFAASVEGEL